MSRPEPPTDNLKVALEKVVSGYLEIYFGGQTLEIHPAWRVAWAFAGALTAWAYLFFEKLEGGFAVKYLALGATIENGHLFEKVLFFWLMLTPLWLALTVGLSIRKGGPLRYFLVGCFLHAMLMFVLTDF